MKYLIQIAGTVACFATPLAAQQNTIVAYSEFYWSDNLRGATSSEEIISNESAYPIPGEFRPKSGFGAKVGGLWIDAYAPTIAGRDLKLTPFLFSIAEEGSSADPTILGLTGKYDLMSDDTNRLRLTGAASFSDGGTDEVQNASLKVSYRKQHEDRRQLNASLKLATAGYDENSGKDHNGVSAALSYRVPVPWLSTCKTPRQTPHFPARPRSKIA